MEITAKLIEKQPVQQVSDKFRKLEFVTEYKDKPDSQYSELLKFQLVNDKCNLIDDIAENSVIKIQFNLRGRKWEKDGKVSYFTTLEAWKIGVEEPGF